MGEHGTVSKHRLIDAGGHEQGEVGACVMEWVSLIRDGRLRRDSRGRQWVDWFHATKTDHPTCTNLAVTEFAIATNDGIQDDRERGRLAHLIPRLLRAGRSGNWRTEARINLRLVLWVLRQRVRSREGKRCLDLIEQVIRGEGKTIEAPRWGLCGDESLVVANAIIHLRQVAEQYADEDNDRVLVEAEVDGLVGDATQQDLRWSPDSVLWLSELLDAHEKIRADEGELGWDPEEHYAEEEDVAELLERLERGR